MARRLLRSLIVRLPQLQNATVGAKRHALRLLRRPFEPEFEILKHLSLGGGQVLVDIGANRGQSIEAIRLYHPDAPIIAFEPQSALAGPLTARFAFDRQIDVRKKALGRECGAMTLYRPDYGGWRFDGLSSLDRNEAAGWLNSKTLAGFDPARLTLLEEAVEVSRLDDEEIDPAFMKIDVQGAEADVLAGGEVTIARARPVLLVETGTNERLVELIERLGYVAHNFENGRLRPRVKAVRNSVFVDPARPRGLERIGATAG